MLTELMQLLGHDEKTAFAFCANIDEYLMQPKYLKMYDLGRTAMKNFENQKADLKLEGAVKDSNVRRHDGRGKCVRFRCCSLTS